MSKKTKKVLGWIILSLLAVMLVVVLGVTYGFLEAVILIGVSTLLAIILIKAIDWIT